MSLLELFCDVDDFWQGFQPHWEQEMLSSRAVHKLRQGQLSFGEMMTIMIHFRQGHYRHFKAYYTECVQVRLRSEFPHLVGYGRFVELMPRVLVPLGAYLVSCYGHCTRVSSSTPLPLPFVPTAVFPVTESLRAAPPGVRVQWVGFSASSSTWWSTIWGSC
jgi:hypothetical protein